MGLLYGENCMILTSAVFAWITRVTDRQTDRQTDGQTDGIAIAYARLAYMLSRAKTWQSSTEVYALYWMLSSFAYFFLTRASLFVFIVSFFCVFRAIVKNSVVIISVIDSWKDSTPKWPVLCRVMLAQLTHLAEICNVFILVQFSFVRTLANVLREDRLAKRWVLALRWTGID